MTAASASRIDLAWDAVSAPAHCTVTYRVYRSTTSGFTPAPSNLVVDGLSVTGYADTGLSASTTYHYVVQAVDGAGAAGTNASATTLAAVCGAAPAAPGSLAATAMSSSRIDLSWGAVTPPAHCTVTYRVFRSTDAVFIPGPSNQLADGLTATSYSDTGLFSSTTYYYVVQAVDEAGVTGANASATTAVDLCAAAPAAPGSLAATAASATRIDLSWAAVSVPAHCTVTYRVYRSVDPGFTPGPANLVAEGLTALTYADEGLLGSTTYYYVVQAVDQVGAAGATTTATTQAYVCGAAPAAPSALTATAISSARIDLSWGAVTPPAHCTVTYRVFRSTDSGFTPDPTNRVADGLAVAGYSDTGLIGSTTYYYVVQAVDEAGATGATASATTQPGLCTAAPAAPGSLTATAASGSRIDLSWSAVTPPQYCTVTYSVYRSTDPAFTPGADSRIATGLGATSFADRGLVASTVYYYVVEAVDAAGQAGASASATTAADGCALDAAGTSWIAFVGQRAGGSGYDVYLVHQDGGCLTRVVGTPGADLWPAFRSTNSLAYSRDAASGAALYLHDVPSGTDSTITLSSAVTPTAPTLTATLMAFEGTASGEARSDIYRTRPTGGSVFKLTAGPSNNAAPVFAPDGTMIYFVSNRTGTNLIHSIPWNATPTTTPTPLAGTGGVLGRPAISPDGLRLAYARSLGGASEIVVRTLATSAEVVISAHGDSSPAFDSTGLRLAVSSTRTGQPAIWTMDAADGGNAVQVTFPIGTEIDGQPAFRP